MLGSRVRRSVCRYQRRAARRGRRRAALFALVTCSRSCRSHA